MDIFSFDEIYGIVRAKAIANFDNSLPIDWYDFYPEADDLTERINTLPSNNTFESDIAKAASILQKDFEYLRDADSDDISQIHRDIENKFPIFLNKYIK